MTIFNTFNKTTLGQLRRELNEVLAKYGQSSGLMITIGNIRFAPDGSTMHTRLDAHVKGKMSDEAAQLGQTPALARVLKDNKMGDTFISPMNGEITLIDYRARSHKYPFIGKRRDGKMFKFSFSQVLAGQSPAKMLAAKR
jgi:hypothetical protein